MSTIKKSADDVVGLHEGWGEYRRLVLKELELLEESQGKQGVDIDQIKEAINKIQIEQKSLSQKYYFFSIAIGFIVSIIGYAIQYFFFTK